MLSTGTQLIVACHRIVVTFSDDARYFVARDGGFFVTAKDGTVRHVDQLGKQFD